MIVAELWEDALDSAPIAHLLWWQCLEVLDSFGMACIFIDLPISGNHSVMSGRGKLYTRNKEGDVTMIAALEDRGARREPLSPEGIRECASLEVKIAHGVVGSRNGLWMLTSIPIDDDAHVYIRAPASGAACRMLPGVLAKEQNGYALLIGCAGFFL